ncbi:MAG TPA: hypothetical protein VIL30_13275 [Ramlibacter sp.]
MFLVFIGAINTVLAWMGGTCAQGGADALLGGIFSLGAYVIGFTALHFSRPRNYWILNLLVPFAIAQTLFALRLAYGHFIEQVSACYVLTGIDEMDGREAAFSFLWLALAAVFLLGMALCFMQLRRRM